MGNRKGCRVVLGYGKTELSPEALDLISRGIASGQVCLPEDQGACLAAPVRHATPDVPFPDRPWEAGSLDA